MNSTPILICNPGQQILEDGKFIAVPGWTPDKTQPTYLGIVLRGSFKLEVKFPMTTRLVNPVSNEAKEETRVVSQAEYTLKKLTTGDYFAHNFVRAEYLRRFPESQGMTTAESRRIADALDPEAASYSVTAEAGGGEVAESGALLVEHNL